MSSLCSRLQYTSQNLLALKEEFDRVYPLACASKNVELTKKLVQAFEHACRKELFPNGKFYTIEIGVKTREELIDALKNEKINVSDSASYMMESLAFAKTDRPEQIELVRLTVGDLFGDQACHTIDQIFERASQFGLRLCPAEVGPFFRLWFKKQPIFDWPRIAMNPIVCPGFISNIFSVDRGEEGFWLMNERVISVKYDPEIAFIFRLR